MPADDERRAEIEAGLAEEVAWAINYLRGIQSEINDLHRDGRLKAWDRSRLHDLIRCVVDGVQGRVGLERALRGEVSTTAERSASALDRLRDARGDDEAALDIPAAEAGWDGATTQAEREQAPGESPTPDDDVIVRWECPECGWSIPDEHSAGEGQPCEAWMLDDEIGEHGPTQRVRYRRIRSPQGEDHGRKVHSADCEWVWGAVGCTCGIGIGPLSRPQGEDHEAVERAAVALCRFVFPGYFVDRLAMARAALTAAKDGGEGWIERLPEKQIAVVSPSRDGTVAVEDVAEALREAATTLHNIHKGSAGASMAACSRSDCRARAALLAEFEGAS